jgi:hypothetical protein
MNALLSRSSNLLNFAQKRISRNLSGQGGRVCTSAAPEQWGTTDLVCASFFLRIVRASCPALLSFDEMVVGNESDDNRG